MLFVKLRLSYGRYTQYKRLLQGNLTRKRAKRSLFKCQAHQQQKTAYAGLCGLQR